MSKQPTPKADQLRALREQRAALNKIAVTGMFTKNAIMETILSASERAKASAEKAKAKRAARRKP